MESERPNDVAEVSLQAIFAAEARVHFAHIDAGLGAPGQAVSAPQVAAVRDALHTLQGAARSVELAELEYLCHALEDVLKACGAALPPAQLDVVRQAAGAARLLVDQPSGRSRNQALALCRQLDAMAAQAGPASPA